MSGAKISLPMLAVGFLFELEMQRQLMAEFETQTRENAADQERARRLAALRDRFILELRDVYVALQQVDALAPADANDLREKADAVLAALQQASDEKSIWNVAKAIPGIQDRLQNAVFRKHSADAQAQKAALPAFDLSEREAWMQRRAEVAQAISELHALVAGLKADPVVMRWHGQAVRELDAQAHTVENQDPITSSPPLPDLRERGPGGEGLSALLLNAQQQAQQIVREANAAQLKADQRDYIAQSIARSLQEMGFIVGEPQAEHPGHPATAKILRAANSVGKGISVSVPTEGQVWYDVDGYPKSTEATLGGGVAAVCDEAEQVLLEMHQRLDEEFGVQMSEIWWEGKEPNRRMRRAEQLPTQTREVQHSVR